VNSTKDPQKAYLEWFVEYLEGEKYTLLLRDLLRIEYFGIVPNDSDRGQIGKSIRGYYSWDQGLPAQDLIDLEGPCTVLEMLVGLARDMADLALDGDDMGDFTVKLLFWEMVENLGLMRFKDDLYFINGGYESVWKTVTRWLERYYSYDGRGSPFPLKNPQRDQRRVPIWLQANAYLRENYDILG
jgi:hypothetical protein